MSSHKIVWYIAFSAAMLAALVLWVRHAGENDAPPAEMVAVMLDRLGQDHPMDEPATKEAVRQVAQLAAAGDLLSAEGYYALGLCHAERSEYGKAEAAFRECIKLKPGWSWAHNALGIVLANHALDRVGEAEAEFRAAVALDPQWSRPHNDLAILLRIADRLDEAELEARLALDLDPGNVATHNNYGNLLVAQNRLEQAEAAYLKAISIEPGHPKPYYNLACVYALRDKRDDALSLLEKSIALSPVLGHDAMNDPDFASLHNDARFIAITREEDRTP